MAAEHATLSQREIDALLNADPGEGDDGARPGTQRMAKESRRRIKPYDFRHPDKLSKEQLRGLQIIQQGVASSMAQSLSARLRVQAEARLTSLDRSIYDEYTNQVGQDAVVVIIDMAPLQGYCVAAFGTDVAFGVLDRLLGGRGKVSKAVSQRELTDIEIALVRHIGADIAGAMVEPWARIAELTPEVSDLAVGPQVVHVVPPSEFVITSWYELSFGEQTATISICLPLTILEQVIPKLSGQMFFEHRTKNQGADEQLRSDQIQPAKVGLRTVLGGTSISAAELGSLELGDVLILDNCVDDPLRVYVGNIERFAGAPGTRGKRLAVQINGLIDGDGAIVSFEGGGDA